MRLKAYLNEIKKLTIDRARTELSNIGYKLTSVGKFDMKRMVATYEVIMPNGKKKTMTDKEITNLLKKS